jgi:hypothetical protein
MLHTKCGAEKSIVLGREVEQDLSGAAAESGGGVEQHQHAQNQVEAWKGGDQGPSARPYVVLRKGAAQEAGTGGSVRRARRRRGGGGAAGYGRRREESRY